MYSLYLLRTRHIDAVSFTRFNYELRIDFAISAQRGGRHGYGYWRAHSALGWNVGICGGQLSWCNRLVNISWIRICFLIIQSRYHRFQLLWGLLAFVWNHQLAWYWV